MVPVRVLLVDNYDSFTYNLLQYLEELGAIVEPVRNDALSVAEAAGRAPDRIVISPGPGTPERSGISVPLIRALAGRIPILGVCLGHQAIAVAFGGRWRGAPGLVHGKSTPVEHDGAGIFKGLSNPFEAARYHSLVVEEASLPDALRITAWSGEPGGRIVMGLAHRAWPLFGVQFHPESFLTPEREGKRLLANFLAGAP